MNPVRRQRLLIIIGALAGLSVAVGLLLYALSSNINMFYSPQQIADGEVEVGQRIRVGGLVVPGTVRRDPESLKVSFDVADGGAMLTVVYEGILPDLFKEGQGIVANGTLVTANRFEAREVLAKHDENYMPPEVQKALERSGHPGAKPSAS
ncbi:cytochrome c maturation protein CcmE [Isoalcanivorax beigongshangi]|uniref:Cytochrome c-type biogenesis protein CcmE n=1 Tax=Isoalcanivorax beigongshangi TaxID=3238810 RepID=A0ABV4AHV0_9GAMM